jgi:G3E family GTPase
MVSIIVLTGFLGSGKTSLLNRLMATRPASRGKLAIIVNEFGAVGIDGSLLPADMSRQVELPGGCICCELNEDLDRTITELLDREPEVETIVVETTGIAEPLPITWTLARPPLSERVRLAAVVTVVDALEHARNRERAPAVDNQVEYGDLLVVSKLDVLGAAEPPEALVALLRERNPDAPILAAAPEQLPALLWQALEDPRAVARPPDTGHAHGHAHGFEVVSVEIRNLLDFEELEEALEELPDNYVRIKGIARVVDRTTGSDQPQVMAFHRVGTRVSREPVAADGPMRAVALGPGVDPAALAACIEAAVIPCDSRR